MLDKIIALDKKLFVFLNGLGSQPFDDLWLIITKQFYWTPLFLLVFLILYKRVDRKQLLFAVLLIAVMILVTDQTANFFKSYYHRLRPCNDPDIMGIIRIVQQRDTYSFFSGHAASSMANAVFIFGLFRKKFRFPYLLFSFPLIFAYSRIYIGVHFPLDILAGYLCGLIYGLLFSRIYRFSEERYLSAS